MALPVTMYRWDDVGAPQIVDGKPSEYMNVLKKCLVEGYGSKASLGWSLIDEETAVPHCAFMNNTTIGSGGVAMFSSTDDAIGQKVIVRGVQDYVDRNVYSRSSPYHAFDYGSLSTYLNKNWILIGTGKAFYFFCFSDATMVTNATGTMFTISFFMGDINSLVPNDPAPFICLSGVKNSTSTSWSYTLPYKFSDSNLDRIGSIHPTDGTDSPSEFTIMSLFDNWAGVAGNTTSAANIRVMSPCYTLMETGSLKQSSPYQNDLTPFVRGLIPGLFIADAPGHRNDVPPVIKDIEGSSYYLTPSSNTGTSCAWINLEAW
ncbi:hypothetical protein [Pseudoalteromonas sp. S3173]|uniref:hypothetical protein n=1 Tax=Pseudoalteromonas sp. S3173 TaxID=579531 RepID=UPI00110CD101|nr:hypothetical protein [Pseudoalteromonas sp. S3173]TMS62704.1 hypothetical protein CWC10_05190 [Pseudoalteromonas sp. S3173]